MPDRSSRDSRTHPSGDRRTVPTHPSPRHPGDDAMPPYSPGGVPEPEVDEKVNPEHAAPAYPPRQKP